MCTNVYIYNVYKCVHLQLYKYNIMNCVKHPKFKYQTLINTKVSISLTVLIIDRIFKT